MSRRSIPISQRSSPDQRLARVSSWCNVQISQASRKLYKHPSTTGRSLVFLKRRTAYLFFFSDAGYVFPRSRERRRKTALYRGSVAGSLRQASLHNEAVQEPWTALYFGPSEWARPSEGARLLGCRFARDALRPAA